MVRRTRRPARGRTVRRRASLVKVISRRDTGFCFSPRPDPPAWKASPWWPFTLFFSFTQASSIKANQLDAVVSAALGWKDYVKGTANIPMAYRMQSVRAYGLSSQPIQLDAYELISGKHIAQSFNDMGGKFTYSSVGFRWGTQSKIDILTNGDDTPIFYVNGFAGDSTIVVYLQVLLRALDAPVPALTMAEARLGRTDPSPLDLDSMVLH